MIHRRSFARTYPAAPPAEGFELETGTWDNPVAGQTVNLRNSALDIQFLVTRRHDASTPAYYKHIDHMPGTGSDRIANNYDPSSGGINSIGVGQFNVGNQLGAGPIQYYAFGPGNGIEYGAYTGTDSGGFTVTGLPFRPLVVWLFPNGSAFDSWFIDGNPFGDGYFTGANGADNFIVSINNDGFTSGSSGDLSSNRYRWVAIAADPNVVGVDQYTGVSGGVTANISSGGATPTFAVNFTRAAPGLFPCFRSVQGSEGNNTNGSVMWSSQSAEFFNGTMDLLPGQVQFGSSNYVSNNNNPYDVFWMVK